jgi:hypothetical protein
MLVAVVVAIVVAVVLIVAVSDWWDRHPDRRPRLQSRVWTPWRETGAEDESGEPTEV